MSIVIWSRDERGVESTLRMSKRTINKQNKGPTFPWVRIVVPPNFGVLLSIYIKRAHRLMDSSLNSIFFFFFLRNYPFFFKYPNLISASFFFFLFFFYFFIFIFLQIFICLLYTYNVNLHYIHTKSGKYYIHLQ